MIGILPSILTSDTKELRSMFAASEGVVKRVHVDILDGKFADNTTIVPEDVAGIETKLAIDFHLMVDKPVNWIDRCVRGQAERIIGQIEKMNSQVEFVGKVQEVGAKIGLAIDLDTPVSKLDPVILNNLDVVLVMSVKAGFGGQKFRKEVIEEIKRLRHLREEAHHQYRICVDGGITLANIKSIVDAGADEVAVGRRLFQGDMKSTIDEYLRSI